MIELRWNGRILEQRTRMPRVNADGSFCDFTAWSEWHPVPTAIEELEPTVGAQLPKAFPAPLQFDDDDDGDDDIWW